MIRTKLLTQRELNKNFSGLIAELILVCANCLVMVTGPD